MKSRDLDMSGSAKASPGGMSGPVRTCLDLPGPVWTSPGGQVLTANQRKCFYFSDFIKSSVLSNKVIIFYKIIGLLREFIMFYKIIGFTDQFYHFYKIIGFTEIL